MGILEGDDPTLVLANGNNVLEPPPGMFDDDETSGVRSRPPPKPIVMLHGRDLARPLPPQPYLVEGLGLVAEGGAPHILAGYAFSGKTVALQSMLLSLAIGRSVWRRYQIPRTFRVIHVDGEQGQALSTRRYQRLANGMGLNLEDLSDEALALVPHPPFALTAEHRPRWVELMSGRDFMIIDSLRALTGGLSENDSEIRAPLDMLGQISEDTKCRALLIAHMGKPSENRADLIHKLRGSSAIADATDGGWGFVQRKGEAIECAQFKARTVGVYCEDWALTIADVANGDDLRWGLAVNVHGVELIQEQRAKGEAARELATEEMSARKVRDVLRKHPEGLPKQRCRALAKLNPRYFEHALATLGHEVTERWIRPEGGGQSSCILTVKA